ncbi:hypothetical protein Rsub_09945 [Raphidocelis subcapitata]|uniref:GATA-type domain-containing protein n=1 Tax=Raphidocelis subcapitata TaxID=307507 RepID=A0A2V0PBL7_9CHLO|nr:hypothetical protein Rsub_09945 [Raphidocelis subcapitata]|eukprot:GBF97254.1 hypothetical protein Rsub_09945 [Raphidocelis subcapitata]
MDAAQNLTFAWLGEALPSPDGSLMYYTAFDFCGVNYTIGEFVFLTPENPEAPLYLARVISAFEDARQTGGDRLCIEVQWYERRANMPAHLQEGMHEREVAEWLQTDTNLVGCIERKARVLRARSYEEAVAQLDPADADGEWLFCRGVLDTENMDYRTYEEVDADPGFMYDPRTGQVLRAAALGGGPSLSGARGAQSGGARASPAASKRGRRRGGSSAAPLTWDRAAAAAAALSGGLLPRPGTLCFECGSKQTPQWREGPAGARTLCNACGMRYQRSQGKCITRPKFGGEFSGGYGAAASPQRKRPASARGGRGGGAGAAAGGGGGKRARGGGKRAREPWEGESDDDYNPSVERGSGGRGARGYYGAAASDADGYDYGYGGEEDEDAGAAASDAAAAYFSAGVPLLPAAGAGPFAPPPPPPAAAPLTAGELRALAARAAALAPELAAVAAGLEGVADGAVEALPPEQRAALAALKAAVEAGLSEVKAADAAVAAVSQVLAQKQALAERAHGEAAAAAARFKDAVTAILGAGGGGEGGEAQAAAAGEAGQGAQQQQQQPEQQPEQQQQPGQPGQPEQEHDGEQQRQDQDQEQQQAAADEAAVIKAESGPVVPLAAAEVPAAAS